MSAELMCKITRQCKDHLSPSTFTVLLAMVSNSVPVAAPANALRREETFASIKKLAAITKLDLRVVAKALDFLETFEFIAATKDGVIKCRY